MKNWANFIASQLLWLACVGGASYGVAWLGPVFFAIFAMLHFGSGAGGRNDLLLMVLALPVGMAVDTTMSAAGLLDYAAAGSLAPVAPAWILALWMGFALTFNHSMAWLMRRPALVVPLGAIVGPFTYWVAAHGWAAVQFTDSLLHVLLPLSTLWGAAMGLFSYVVRHLEKAPFPPLAGAP